MSIPRQIVLQMSGAPGSGKSTTASLISRHIDAVVINHDLLRSFFLDNSITFDQSAKLAYDLQWTLARDMLEQGRSIVIDSTCNYQETLDKGIALARQHNVEYWYIECKINDINLIDSRLRNRISPMRSQRTGVYYAPSDTGVQRTPEESTEIFKKWMNSPVRPAGNIIVVDSTCSPQDSLHYVLEQLAMPFKAQTSNGVDSKASSRDGVAGDSAF